MVCFALALVPTSSAYTVDDLAAAARRGLPAEAIESIAADLPELTRDDVVLLLRSGVSRELIATITGDAHPTDEEIAAAELQAPVGRLSSRAILTDDACSKQLLAELEPMPTVDFVLEEENRRQHRAGVGLVVGGTLSLLVATGAFAFGAAAMPDDDPKDPLAFAAGAFSAGLSVGFTTLGWTFGLAGVPMVVGGGMMVANHPIEPAANP